MKAIVTGGAGFIGSHVVDRLLEKDFEVIIIDNLTTTQGSRRNIEGKNVVFYEIDITDREAIFEVFKNDKPDYVFHLAAQASVAVSMKKPEFDWNINVNGSKNIIDAAIESGVKKIIYSGSGGTLYGDYFLSQNNDPLSLSSEELESMAPDEEKPVAPISPYGKSKAEVINLLKSQDKIKWTALLYANVYGRRQDPHGEAGVVAIFSKMMLNNKQPTIFGEGICIRDYVYVGDVADANIAAMDKGDYELINIGTNKCADVNKIFQEIKMSTGFAGEAAQAPFREGDALVNILKVGKAKEILNWEPKVDLAQGLALTVESFQNENK